jgi:hypothetical protein
MEQEMEFLRAPQENIRTWDRVIKMITWSCIAIALLLLILAATLL